MPGLIYYCGNCGKPIVDLEPPDGVWTHVLVGACQDPVLKETTMPIPEDPGRTFSGAPLPRKVFNPNPPPDPTKNTRRFMLRSDLVYTYLPQSFTDGQAKEAEKLSRRMFQRAMEHYRELLAAQIPEATVEHSP